MKAQLKNIVLFSAALALAVPAIQAASVQDAEARPGSTIVRSKSGGKRSHKQKSDKKKSSKKSSTKKSSTTHRHTTSSSRHSSHRHSSSSRPTTTHRHTTTRRSDDRHHVRRSPQPTSRRTTTTHTRDGRTVSSRTTTTSRPTTTHRHTTHRRTTTHRPHPHHSSRHTTTTTRRKTVHHRSSRPVTTRRTTVHHHHSRPAPRRTTVHHHHHHSAPAPAVRSSSSVRDEGNIGNRRSSEFYVTGGMGMSGLAAPQIADLPLPGLDFNVGFGGKKGIVAMEMGFGLAGYRFDPAASSRTANLSMYSMTGDLKLQPSFSFFEPYVVGGMGGHIFSDHYIEETAVGASLRLGGGVDLRFQNVALNAQYMRSFLGMVGDSTVYEDGVLGASTETLGVGVKLYF